MLADGRKEETQFVFDTRELFWKAHLERMCECILKTEIVKFDIVDSDDDNDD